MSGIPVRALDSGNNGDVLVTGREGWAEWAALNTNAFKAAARMASTENLVATRVGSTLTADSTGALGAIDGVTPAVSDRVLLKDQTTGANRGIYTISSLGGVGSYWVMMRAADFDESAEIKGGVIIPVSEGTANGNKAWQLTTNDPITINSTSLTFAQVGAAIGVATPQPVGAAGSAGSTGNAADEGHVHADPLRAVKGTDVANDGTAMAIAQGRWRVLQAATLSANRSQALSVAGAVAGDQMVITRLDVTDYTYTVTDAGPGTPTLFVFPGGSVGSIMCQFDGTNWFLKQSGIKHAAASATIPGTMTAAMYTMASRLKVASKTVAFGDITDAGTTHTIDFAAALPAGAYYLGAMANCTAIFDNAGDSASVTFDLGIKSGDTDAFLDGASLNSVAMVYTPVGVGLVAGGSGVHGFAGGVTPSIIFTGDVNLDTLTKGSAVFYVYYLDLTTP